MKQMMVMMVVLGVSGSAVARISAVEQQLTEQINYLQSLHVSERLDEIQALLAQQQGQIDDLKHQLSRQGNSTAQRVSLEKKTEKVMKEDEWYHHAIKLMQQKHYKEANVQFEGFMKQYPQSKFAPNTYYWMAEIHLLNGRQKQAIDAFKNVVSGYGDHAKAPDALFKWGMTELAQGHREKAIELFQELRQKYPKATSSHLAYKQLERLNARS